MRIREWFRKHGMKAGLALLTLLLLLSTVYVVSFYRLRKTMNLTGFAADQSNMPPGELRLLRWRFHYFSEDHEANKIYYDLYKPWILAVEKACPEDAYFDENVPLQNGDIFYMRDLERFEVTSP